MCYYASERFSRLCGRYVRHALLKPMTSRIITSCTLAAFAAVPFVTGAEPAPCCSTQPGAILQKMDLLTPDSSAPAYKIKANDRVGSQWHVDLAYGYFNVHDTDLGKSANFNLALLHGHVNQRIIKDDTNGGTWLHAEFIGSWGVEKETIHQVQAYPNLIGSVTSPHRDYVGPYDFYFPEVSIKHFFNGKKAAIVAGMVKFGDYFDAVGIANDTYTSFTNSGFCNSTVLPLIDSNVGALAQVQIGKKNYLMGGVTRTGTAPGYNPLNCDDGSGYTVMAEWGHYFNEGKGVFKITPFFTSIDEPGTESDGSSKHRRNGGAVASVQYDITDGLTVFIRGGAGAKQSLGNAAELTGGLRAKLIPSRENDYLGIAYGVFKGQNDKEGIHGDATEHNRELVLEAYYNLQLGRYFRVMPHVQYIKNPAYSPESDAVIAGVQTVFSF